MVAIQCSNVVGNYNNGTNAGSFAFNNNNGNSNNNNSFRVVVVPLRYFILDIYLYSLKNLEGYFFKENAE